MIVGEGEGEEILGERVVAEIGGDIADAEGAGWGRGCWGVGGEVRDILRVPVVPEERFLIDGRGRRSRDESGGCR